MANVITEVHDIIISALSIREKIAALESVYTDRRPGKAEAESLIREYLQRICDRKNELIQKHSPRVKGFFKRGTGYAYDSFLEQHTIHIVNRFEVGILRRTRHEYTQTSPAASAFRASKSEKFSRYCESIVPSQYWLSAMKILGIFPEKVAAEDRAAYRLNLLKVVGEIAAFETETGLSYTSFFGNQVNVLQCQYNGSVDAYRAKSMYCKAGGCIFVVRHDETEDWDKYSKGWHNQHGPYREITARYIQVFRGGAEVAKIQLEGFRGQYLVNAISQFLSMAPIKVARSLKAVQLNPLFGVAALHTIGNCTLYRRTFGGETVDYCAVANGTTFHANTTSAALQGLRTKLEKMAAAETARLEAEGKVLTADYCHKTYGFCETGIQEFCCLNGLDFSGTYTVREIRAAVLPNRAENCQRFAQELRTIGITLNCK